MQLILSLFEFSIITEQSQRWGLQYVPSSLDYHRLRLACNSSAHLERPGDLKQSNWMDLLKNNKGDTIV